MHPSLQTSNITDLPISCRKYALNAAAGSVKDMEMLFSLIDAQRIPTTKLGLLLPVFYQNLDVCGCPTPESIDIGGPKLSSSIMGAIGSMQGLVPLYQKRQITNKVAEELWPRLWTWIQTLDLYRDVVEQIIPRRQHATYGLFIHMFYLARPDPGTVLSADIPGMRAILARCWMYLVQDDVNEAGFRTLALFFYSDAAPARSDHLLEYIDGAGGTIDTLATLIMDHLALNSPSSHSRRKALSPHANYHFYVGLVRLLTEGDEADDPLSTALLNRGFIRRLTALTCHYGRDPKDEREKAVLQLCLSLLINKLTAFAGYKAVGDALQSHRLIEVIGWCVHHDHPDVKDVIRFLLNTVLPRCMVSYSILSTISRHRNEDKLFSLPKPLPNAPWFEKWMLFYNVAKKNMEVFESYRNGQYIPIRGCDNMKCGELRRSQDIKRCGSCHEMNYCSTECQRVDWEEGHRNMCDRLRPLHLESDHLTLRERSFITALGHHDHEASILDLCLKKISFMHSHQDEAFYTLFDYTSTHFSPLIRSVQRPPRLRTSTSNAMLAQWEDQVSRAARSEGRMELLVVLFGDGKSTYRRMVPLRSQTAVLHTGLRRIAGSFEADMQLSEVDIRQEVENLLARRRELGEHALQWEGVQTD
ncbi:hypothetical protein R3P38DRAFT_2664825 [Favolaschia claudopus]|uniref:MYND-type domain-containing protein n=1 Tax=Favolaschia claudopus TaxID=2862362 RepID=A0AAV9ZFD3_9AGAR